MKIILIAVFTSALLINATTKAEPLEMGDGNRVVLQNSYSHYQFHNRYDSYSLNEIRGVYAQERARQVCTNWKVWNQIKFNTCVNALSKEFVKVGE